MTCFSDIHKSSDNYKPIVYKLILLIVLTGSLGLQMHASALPLRSELTTLFPSTEDIKNLSLEEEEDKIVVSDLLDLAEKHINIHQLKLGDTRTDIPEDCVRNLKNSETYPNKAVTHWVWEALRSYGRARGRCARRAAFTDNLSLAPWSINDETQIEGFFSKLSSKERYSPYLDLSQFRSLGHVTSFEITTYTLKNNAYHTRAYRVHFLALHDAGTLDKANKNKIPATGWGMTVTRLKHFDPMFPSTIKDSCKKEATTPALINIRAPIFLPSKPPSFELEIEENPKRPLFQC